MDRNSIIDDLETIRSGGKPGKCDVMIVEGYTDEQLTKLRKVFSGLIINELRHG